MDFQLRAVADRESAPEYVRGILWTVFFHRLFGTIQPGTRQFLGSRTYPVVVGYKPVERVIDRKVAEVERLIQQTVPTAGSGSRGAVANVNLVVRFLNGGVCWERWTLAMAVLDNRDPRMLGTSQAARLAVYKDDFAHNLMRIVELVDENRDHIPPVPSADVAPFDYEIAVAAGSEHNSASSSSMEFVMAGSNDTTDPNANMNAAPPAATATATATADNDDLLRNGYNFLRKFLE